VSASAAFFFSRALTLAVVERTAVATFVGASFFAAFVVGGYAKRLGFAFEVKLNWGG
jgi:hypothetical protein